MSDVVVTIVDDTIIQVSTIVLIGRACCERSQLLQVFVGHAGHHLNKVTTHLSLEIILVGNSLHGLQHTEGKEYVVQDGDIIEFLFNV